MTFNVNLKLYFLGKNTTYFEITSALFNNPLVKSSANPNLNCALIR